MTETIEPIQQNFTACTTYEGSGQAKINDRDIVGYNIAVAQDHIELTVGIEDVYTGVTEEQDMYVNHNVLQKIMNEQGIDTKSGHVSKGWAKDQNFEIKRGLDGNVYFAGTTYFEGDSLIHDLAQGDRGELINNTEPVDAPDMIIAGTKHGYKYTEALVLNIDRDTGMSVDEQVKQINEAYYKGVLNEECAPSLEAVVEPDNDLKPH